MRANLDWLYRASGALAAFFLVAICVVVLLQVGANLIDAVIKAFGGEPIGLVIPSYAEFTGFFLAASSFLALAYTLRAGGHIRVELVLQRLGKGPRRFAEFWCVAAGAAVSMYFTWYSTSLVFESIEFGDLSPGIVPVPIWIPQAAMALGLAVLAIALIDELVSLMRGGEPRYVESESANPAGHE
ncbi:MAG: TRAP transporter small permease [Gammaproteobacteria bacterium]|nr:TRAP transporter small permease [Gammaproteobacteria bacterium]